MSSFKEKKERCPYDPNHELLPERMAQHLVKCRRQHPHVKKEICRFNSTHHVDPENMKKHLKYCRDADLVTKTKIISGVTAYNDPKKPAFTPPVNDLRPQSRPHLAQADQGEEDWEAEMEGNVPYNPSVCAASKMVMRRPTVLTTKSERRQFREDEFQRWSKIQTKKEDEDTKNNNTTQVSLNGGNAETSSISPVKPVGLRRPLTASTSSYSVAHQSLTLVDDSTTAAPRGFDGALSIGGGGIVKSIGRGRGSVAARFGGGGGGVSALGGLRRPSLAASEAATQSVTGSFGTSEFKSLGEPEESIISGNINRLRI